MTYPSVEEIASKMDALGLWDRVGPYNWAVKPCGTVFPYFCTLLKGDAQSPVKMRLLMLEGWQTMHDYVHVRMDHDYGFFSSPAELPHLGLVFAHDGTVELSRFDPGYMPVKADEAQRQLAVKLLWESYGLMLRVESDTQLLMRFAGEKAVFARVEQVDGTWKDEPLVIPDPRTHVERVTYDKALLKTAQDLPIDEKWAVAVDFRLVPDRMTREPRPRTVYELTLVTVGSGEVIHRASASVLPESGLRGLWEMMPQQVLKCLVASHRMPGQVWVRSGRVFRLLRTLCLELPFKLSLHDAIAELSA